MLPSKACQSLCWEEKHFQQQFVGSLGRLLSFMCGFSLNCSNHLLPNVQICTGGFSTQIYSALSGAHYPSAWWSFLRRGPVIMISATLSFSIRASNQTRERDVWFCLSARGEKWAHKRWHVTDLELFSLGPTERHQPQWKPCTCSLSHRRTHTVMFCWRLLLNKVRR